MKCQCKIDGKPCENEATVSWHDARGVARLRESCLMVLITRSLYGRVKA